jgi:hypothetical protein
MDHGYFAENLLLSSHLDKWRTDMNDEYKGYRITAWAERDDTTGLWNGRYRILEQQGTVAYESFAEPTDDESKAHEAASAKARAWVAEHSPR